MKLPLQVCSVFIAVFALTAFGETGWTAQAQGQVISPERHIRDLHEGILLVRLPSNQRKIEALETMLGNAELSDKDRDRIAQNLEKTKIETRQLHDAYINAFHEEYSFSRYGFFLDYNTPLIREGKIEPFEAEGATEVYALPDDNWYILSIGHTSGMKVDGMQVLDSTFTVIERPFPSAVITSGLTAILAEFQFKNPISGHVRRLNRKLHRFYDRVD